MNKPMADSLTPAWKVDIYADDVDEGVAEAAGFLNKMDSEGGLQDFLGWGGVDAFPVELRVEAQVFADAEDALQAAITAWAAERGVSQ